MIKGTVALPVWKSKEICWLPMESLCRQNKPKDGWELIVFEEEHPEALGGDWFFQYEGRLKEVGCERLVYLTSEKKLALSQKWVTIAKEASETSEYYCMCASDDYYHSFLLIEAEGGIKVSDWCLTSKGYFYDFTLDKVILYEFIGSTGLHMIAKTDLVRKFSDEEVHIGVDGWFFKQMKEQGITSYLMITSENWKNILCTNGFNNISTHRIKYLDPPIRNYYKTDTKLEEIVPEDIYNRLMELKKSLHD